MGCSAELLTNDIAKDINIAKDAMTASIWYGHAYYYGMLKFECTNGL